MGPKCNGLRAVRYGDSKAAKRLPDYRMLSYGNPPQLQQAARLHSLDALQIIHRPAEERFDAITRLTVRLLESPIAQITPADETCLSFRSPYGTTPSKMSREHFFCTFYMTETKPLVVPDSRADQRFPANQGWPEHHIYPFAQVPLC